MNLTSVLFFTACDANYFELCMDLIKSLRHARGEIPRMRVFDVGLHPQQIEVLRKLVEAVIEPGWDLGQDESYPPWFRAMTSRPFLPKYTSDAEIIVWIDADAWVQSWAPLNDLICAASSGELAIAEESFGAGFAGALKTLSGATYSILSSPGISKAYARRCYEQCFGPEIAAAYGDLPMFNSGVFALRADSSTWAVWRDVLTNGLRGGFNKLVEQQALCIAIRQGRIPVAPQSQETNFVCAHGLPWFDPDSRKFALPKRRDALIGIVHLTDFKDCQVAPIPTFPYGNKLPMSLRFRERF